MSVKFERPEILRPPSEAYSYFLPVTYGCSNHSCTFCRFYGVKLVLRDIEEVKREIDAMHLYLSQHLMIRRESSWIGLLYYQLVIDTSWD